MEKRIIIDLNKRAELDPRQINLLITSGLDGCIRNIIAPIASLLSTLDDERIAREERKQRKNQGAESEDNNAANESQVTPQMLMEARSCIQTINALTYYFENNMPLVNMSVLIEALSNKDTSDQDIYLLFRAVEKLMSIYDPEHRCHPERLLFEYKALASKTRKTMETIKKMDESEEVKQHEMTDFISGSQKPEILFDIFNNTL